MIANLLIVLALLIASVSSFQLLPTTNMVRRTTITRSLGMEYIPDGMSKAQWKALKEKEAQELKGKDLSKVGITKFKSRSFESWQKGGARHLFPVGKDTKVDERPYMQRTGGSFDGEDLMKKGIKGIGQAMADKKTEIDKKYEQLEKEGKLKSAPFSIPWSSSDVEKLSAANKKENAANKPTTSKAPSKSVKKPIGKVTTPVKEEEPKKKGFFGLF